MYDDNSFLAGMKKVGAALSEGHQTARANVTPTERPPLPVSVLCRSLTAVLLETPAGQAAGVIEQALTDAYGEEFGRVIADCIGKPCK